MALNEKYVYLLSNFRTGEVFWCQKSGRIAKKKRKNGRAALPSSVTNATGIEISNETGKFQGKKLETDQRN